MKISCTKTGCIFRNHYYFFLIFIVSVMTWVLSCSVEDDVLVIRKMVANGVMLAEKKDIAGLLERGSDNFIAMPGDLNKRNTKAILWRAFRYYGQFRIVHPQPIVLLEEDDRAFVSFPFLVVREEQVMKGLAELYDDPEQWLREVGKKADLYNIDLELVLEKRDWKVHRATLGRLF